MSTRDVPGGKGGRCVRLTTYHHIVPMSRNLGALALLDPSGPAVGVLYLYLYLNSFKREIKEERKMYSLKINTLLCHSINEKCRKLKIFTISRRY
jgi:hypothetical protein